MLLKRVLTVIHNLRCAIHRQEVLLAIDLALLKEGCNDILFIEIGVAGNEIIQRSVIALACPLYVRGQNRSRNIPHRDSGLKLLLCLGIISLYDRLDDDLLLGSVKFVDQNLHILSQLAA
ncbi:hypothetical protein D3C78_968530 [compost metagenome]